MPDVISLDGVKRSKLQQLRESQYSFTRPPHQQYTYIIHQVLQAIRHCKGTMQSIQAIVASASRALALEDCVAYLVSDDGQFLEQCAAWGTKASSHHPVKTPLKLKANQGVVGYVFQTGKPELITNTRSDDRYIHDDATRVLICT